MCGIAGGCWVNGYQESHLDSRLINALALMKLRGPNDQGYKLHSHGSNVVALGHTRLSIIDLSAAGHQPMYSEDMRFGLVFNGEIYNYRELRQELVSLGNTFKSDSDTEVLLKAWQTWGYESLQRLKGMFAFAIYDSHLQKITCARDAFGIKPFYYSVEQGSFMFASDIRAIQALKSQKSQLNWQRAYDYLVHGDYDSNQDTFIANVHHLMPGHVLEFDITSKSIKSLPEWWQPNIQENTAISFEEATESLRSKFLENIKLHLRSDVPLGAALSGGIDSSSVVCAIRHLEPDIPIHTFSYIAKGTSISEESWVDLVNHHTNAIPHKVTVTADELANDLNDMIVAQGEPFGSTSIYAQYRVFKLAKENGITVTLDGQGADELLAGYRGYPGKRVKSLLDERKVIDALKFLRHWSAWPDRTFSNGLKLSVAELVNAEWYQYLRNLHGDKRSPGWLNENVLKDAGVNLAYPRQLAENESAGRRLVAELGLSLTKRGLPSLLRHGDRNSMRFSVESRVPFLTHDFADFTLSLPENFLISAHGETKHIFRAAMRGIVPDEILDRKDKIGFETPEKQWLIGMSSTIEEWLKEDIKLPFLNQQEILKEYTLITAGKKAFSWQVWRWINFIRWHTIFLN